MARMTLELSEPDEVVVQKLMESSGLNKTQLIRCALRFYQIVDLRTRTGHELAFVKDGVYVPVVVVGPGLSPWTGEAVQTEREHDEQAHQGDGQDPQGGPNPRPVESTPAG